ncbi:hypothetical protein [Phenylobacterium sp.]|uniref:hypothetical protein n=1 Tax=Phenylobacterium sp. TaxID=1871053 RepID=UPI00356AE7BA
MRILIGVVGGLALALGLLWLLQGLGLVHVKPILCAADCAGIEGRSTLWAVIGLVTAAAGAWGVVYGFFRRRRS